MSVPGTTAVDRIREPRGVGLRGFDPTLPVWIGAAAFVIFLILLPLGSIFVTSLYNETGLTLRNYLDVFIEKAYIKAIWNTLIISFWVGIIAVLIGSLLGWLLTRTDLPFKKSIRALVMA